MPTFQGIISEEQLAALVAYVKSLTPAAEHRGARWHKPTRPQSRASNAVGSKNGTGVTAMATAVMPEQRTNYLNAEHGVKSWLLTTDHKRIALLYMLSVTFFFFIGGIYALLIRLEL